MDNKKKVAAAVAATIAASGAAVDASFDNPADLLQAVLLPGIGKETAITDPAEALRQDMHEETADEFFPCEE